MELIRYLNQCFFTEAQLLERAGLDAAGLERLQQRRMMPQPSYRLRLDVACDSFFGAHREQGAVDYYAKGSAAWIGALATLAGEAGARRLFGERYRRRLSELAASGIVPAGPNLAGDEHIDAEWGHFLDGTYGLCTLSGLPEDIAAKEAAIVVIRDAIADERALTDAKRQCLRVAVDLLDSVSAPFAPHEVARSSRHRYVDEVRKTYGL
jgi:hypothetical protein